MTCRMGDLRNKEVINVRDGSRMGYVCDLELDTAAAVLTALVVYGKLRLFGILGREPDLVIPWDKVGLIGDDTVLVDLPPRSPQESPGALARLWARLGL